MSYQDELNKFFKQRAESFKQEGITIDKDKKIGYLYQYIQCFFNSLPKDAKWVEKWKGDINESGYESKSKTSEYNFSGIITLHFVQFNYDYSYIPEEEMKKFIEYSYQGDDIDDEEYYDWEENFTDRYLRHHACTPYQFATGTFKIDDMDFSDFLILNPDFYSEDQQDNVYQEPFDGYRAEANYKGYKIFHPIIKKFVPVEMHCEANWCDEELYIKSELSVKDYIKRLKL